MRRLVWSQVRFRPARPVALGLSILVAAVSFTLLTAAARTSRIEVRGTVESNFRAAYDVLVRPPSAVDPRERSQALVRPNFLSGIFGGITLAQYEEIKGVPGVEVAAPIANVGYVLPLEKFGLPLNRYLTQEPVQLYRIRPTWIAHNGTSRYEGDPAYVYYTRRHPFSGGQKELVPGRAEPLPVCQGIDNARPAVPGPFDRGPYIACYSALSPEIKEIPQLNNVLRVGEVGNEFAFYFPVFVAAIDPEQEARLLRLDETIASGRYLRSDDGPRIEENAAGAKTRSVPAIVSTKSYADERLVLEVERLQLPSGVDVPEMLASSRASSFVEGLRGKVVKREERQPADFYARIAQERSVFSFSFWTVGDVRYRSGSGPLQPAPTSNPNSVWESPFQSGGPGGVGYWAAPPSNADLQFRRLVSHPLDNRCPDICRGAAIKLVGTYDAEKLPGFSPLSQVPLETYYPPLLSAADERSRRILGGKPLRPTQNLGDYIQQPPLLLITLEGMRPFLNPVFYARTKGRMEAPISAIRVRVKGVSGPDELSQARVRAVAQQIHERTGLAVDITAGSSPKPLPVQLPAGKFGRPELLLTEGWSKKGAAVTFANAVDRKSLAVFGLILVICGLFLGNGAFASVRARRAEIGVLLTLGWSRRDVFRAVLAELVFIGLAAGLLGLALALSLIRLLDLDLPVWQSGLVLPLAVGLAVVAGLLPARRAAGGSPLDALRPPVSVRPHRRRINGLTVLAVANLRRTPTRTAVGAAGLVIGVAALTVLVAIQQAFQGVLVDTLLGQAISIQVRTADLAAVALTIALAGLSVADVLFLNLRERAAEIVTLRTVGWGERHLGYVVALEALGLGLIGSLGGAGVGILVGARFGVPLGSLVVSAIVAAGGGLAVALLASLVPLRLLATLTPPTVLADE